MRAGGEFTLRGNYRTQSQMTSRSAAITGQWAVPGAEQLSDADLNIALARDPDWKGFSKVSLRPAFIRFREGVFERCHDILYKADQFAPDPGSNSMPSNIVDVLKAAAGWSARYGVLCDLLGADVAYEIRCLISDVEGIASDEYMVHEAGHAIGMSTDEKYNAGYFRLNGRILWPLIYMEELRADLLSFGFAADLLPPERAATIFLYNVFLRFGVHFAGLRRQPGQSPYGTISYVLFCLLRQLGWISAERGDGAPMRVAGTEIGSIVALMKRCSTHAREEIVAGELGAGSALDVAINAANFQREAVKDFAAARLWNQLEEQMS